MNDLIIEILAVLLVGGALLFLAHWSRKGFELNHGKPTKEENIRGAFIFIGWLFLFMGFMLIWPTVFGWFYVITIFLGIPFALSKPSRKVGWQIQNMGFMAFVLSGPVAFFYYFS